MSNLKLAFRRLLNTPFVSLVAILSLALGIGANAAIFSLFDQMLLAPLPVQEPDRLVNLGAPGPKPGSQSCSRAGDCDVVFSYPMFRDLEKASTAFSAIAAHVEFDAQCGVSRPDVQQRRHAGVGIVLSGARTASGSRAPFRSGRRHDHRGAFRRGPELRVLGDEAGRERRCSERTDHRQRSVDDDRRRRAARLRRHHARHAARALRADHDARPDDAGLEGLRQPPQLLDVSLRAAEAGRHDRAGAHGDQCAVSRHRQRRRGTAPERHERADAGEVPREAGDRGGGTAGAELDARGRARTAGAADVDHRHRPPDRLREHCEPAAGARRGARGGDGCAAVARREPLAAAETTAHRIAAARRARRRVQPARRTLDARAHRDAAAGAGGRHARLLAARADPGVCRRAVARHRACCSASSRRCTARGPI